jgi:hypothetical protein
VLKGWAKALCSNLIHCVERVMAAKALSGGEDE